MDSFVVTVGGDCGVELEPLAAARRKRGDRLVVVWFDAHGDLNTPESSPSGAYDGMVLRALVDRGPRGLTADPVVDPRRVVLAGVRDLDPAEAAFIAEAGVGHVKTAGPEALIRAVTAAGRRTPDSSGESASGSPGNQRGRRRPIGTGVTWWCTSCRPRCAGARGVRERGDAGARRVPARAARADGDGSVRAVRGGRARDHRVRPGRPEDREVVAPVVKALTEACAINPAAPRPGRPTGSRASGGMERP